MYASDPPYENGNEVKDIRQMDRYFNTNGSL